MQLSVNLVASFQQATANRRFSITKEGRMELRPRWTEPEDAVCISLGSQVPFVLRAVDDYFKLVGECYCHVILEWGAVRDSGEGGNVL